MEDQPKQAKKSNVTISVDSEILEQIKYSSEKKGLSINKTINELIKNSVLFGQYFTDHTPIMMAPQVFSFLLEHVDEEIWLQVWELALSEIGPSIYAMHNIDRTLDNFVNYTLGDMGIRTGVFDKVSCTRDNNGRYRVVIGHKYGKKWSKVLATSFSQLFEKTFNVKCVTCIFPSTFTIEIGT